MARDGRWLSFGDETHDTDHTQYTLFHWPALDAVRGEDSPNAACAYAAANWWRVEQRAQSLVRICGERVILGCHAATCWVEVRYPYRAPPRGQQVGLLFLRRI